MGGSSQFDNVTKLFKFNREPAVKLYSAPRRSHIRRMAGEARASQKNISKVRCCIERAFGSRSLSIKSVLAKDRQKLFYNPVSRENDVITVLANLRQLIGNSACSAPFSDVLPPDLCLHM